MALNSGAAVFQAFTQLRIASSSVTISLSNRPVFCANFGERGGNRTYNLVIKSHLLCQLSYAPILWGEEAAHNAAFDNIAFPTSISHRLRLILLFDHPVHDLRNIKKLR
jgi:hypothetical protein